MSEHEHKFQLSEVEWRGLGFPCGRCECGETQDFKAFVMTLEAERDRLLEACKAQIEAWDNPDSDSPCQLSDAEQLLRIAIAKAEANH